MAVSLSDIIQYKRLVAVGNDEIWYEDLAMSAGSMTELTDANGDIDTTDQLNMFELYQKVFIVNGSNLKVADFINSKITTADLGANPPDKGTILTGGTFSASMVVDYITSLSDDAACTIYGYNTTSNTFASGETVTGTDDDGNAISFVLNAAETTGPLWYNWTVYGNDTSYGTMPTKGYLGCNYRGRAVIAGHPAYPYQWYMSRQGNPWDWNFTANDVQSAVAGNNADAGEIGDIVRALIPYKDQYLIFGCANSMWYMRGDPAESAAIDSMDRTIGIFGANSWCFSSDACYFWGTGGIYKSVLTSTGPSQPQLLTGFSLPNIINDEAADPSTHRIILGYDRKRLGILICITTLADGTNSNYFYSLKTDGIFPEEYPEECAAYSICYYDANDNDYADLLLGSRDGYILKFDNSAKDDDIGASDEAISSHCTLPITKLSEGEDNEGKVTSMTVVTAGGASSGEFGDTDGLSYERHIADDAETCLENIIDGDTAFDSGTFSGTGRKNRVRDRIRGMYLGIKLYNSTASETWAVDEVQIDIKKAGRK